MDARHPSGTPPSDTAVELRGVRKVYRQRQRSEKITDALRGLVRPEVKTVVALDAIDLVVGRSEIVAYAGPNGAGKSTTIKLLAGLLRPDGGDVHALGMDPVRDRKRYVGRIGVVFGQRTELWWDHPVAASFEWRRVVWDVPADVYTRTLPWVRTLLGLDEFWNSTARELSLGQKMRAELGLALISEPELLLLDEPTIGLDVLAKHHLLEAIRDLNRDRGVTVVVTSHDMDDLERLAGRIVMIDRGRIAFDGDFAQLRAGVGGARRLLIETPDAAAPSLDGAEHLSSDGTRHTYAFDATRTTITALLDQAAAQTRVLDVETHRPPIDDVVADLYRRWR